MNNLLEMKKILSEFHLDLMKKDMEWQEEHDERYPLCEIWNKTRKVMAQRKLQECYNIAYEVGAIDPKIYGLREKLKAQKSDRVCGRFFWLTIRPPHDTPYDAFKKAVIKLSKKKFIKSYMYVYEQTASKQNERELGHGFHIHMVFEKTPEAEAPSKIKKYISNGFVKLMDVNNSACFHVKVMPSKYIPDKIDYMLDKNLDDDHKDKEEKQEYDVLWREQNNLQPYYIGGEEGELYESIQSSVRQLGET